MGSIEPPGEAGECLGLPRLEDKLDGDGWRFLWLDQWRSGLWEIGTARRQLDVLAHVSAILSLLSMRSRRTVSAATWASSLRLSPWKLWRSSRRRNCPCAISLSSVSCRSARD